jgi:putative transcriptional regulator
MDKKNRLIEIRMYADLTQKDVARGANISLRTIQRIELENHQPSLYTIFRLADFLNVKVEDIFIYI